jgi:chromosome partitioning protein
MLGIPAAYVMTDDPKRRQLLSDEKRVYSILDGTTVENLEARIATAKQHNGNGVLVIDGGGNRAAVDDLIASVADAIILPFTADDDAVWVVHNEMKQFSKAWALPSNWTTNAKAFEVDAGFIQKLRRSYPGRMLPPAFTTHSIRDLALQSFSGTLLPPAQRYCRTIAHTVTKLLGD